MKYILQFINGYPQAVEFPNFSEAAKALVEHHTNNNLNHMSQYKKIKDYYDKLYNNGGEIQFIYNRD